jgi:hypothetical protein
MFPQGFIPVGPAVILAGYFMLTCKGAYTLEGYRPPSMILSRKDIYSVRIKFPPVLL